MTRFQALQKKSIKEMAQLLCVPSRSIVTKIYREENNTYQKQESVEGWTTPDGEFFQFQTTALIHTMSWLKEKEENQ